MGNGTIIKPQINGKATVDHYLRNVRNLWFVKQPDISTIRREPTVDEINAYKNEIINLVIERKMQHVDAAILYEAARTVSDRSNNIGTAEYFYGLRPGSDDPLHYGHVSAGLGAILHFGSQRQGLFRALSSVMSGHRPLNGVIFASGGKVPDKPEVSAFAHREAMANIALNDFFPWIMPSSIRNMMAEALGSAYINVSNKMMPVMGANVNEQRAFCDIAAFNWLFAMNPLMKWCYITGSDKVNGYGEKNEEQLVFHTLYRNKVKVLYFERDDQPVEISKVYQRVWLKKCWQQDMFIKSTVSSYSGLSATKLRNMIVNLNPEAENELNPDQIRYMSENGLLDLYGLNDSVKREVISRASEEYKEKINSLRAKKIID